MNIKIFWLKVTLGVLLALSVLNFAVRVVNRIFSQEDQGQLVYMGNEGARFVVYNKETGAVEVDNLLADQGNRQWLEDINANYILIQDDESLVVYNFPEAPNFELVEVYRVTARSLLGDIEYDRVYWSAQFYEQTRIAIRIGTVLGDEFQTVLLVYDWDNQTSIAYVEPEAYQEFGCGFHIVQQLFVICRFDSSIYPRPDNPQLFLHNSLPMACGQNICFLYLNEEDSSGDRIFVYDPKLTERLYDIPAMAYEVVTFANWDVIGRASYDSSVVEIYSFDDQKIMEIEADKLYLLSENEFVVYREAQGFYYLNQGSEVHIDISQENYQTRTDPYSQHILYAD